MKNLLKISAFALLSVLSAYSMHEEYQEPVTGNIIEDKDNKELSERNSDLRGQLDREEHLSEQKYHNWAYHPEMSSVDNPNSKPIEIKSESRSFGSNIVKFFSDWWNGRTLKKNFIKNSEKLNNKENSNEAMGSIFANEGLKEKFKKLDDSKKLEIINDFVKEEKNKLRKNNQNLEIIQNLTQAKFGTSFRNDPNLNTLLKIQKSSELEQALVLRRSFNTRLDNFRKQINDLFQEKQLKYNRTTGKFEFHEGQAPQEPIRNISGQTIGYTGKTTKSAAPVPDQSED